MAGWCPGGNCVQCNCYIPGTSGQLCDSSGVVTWCTNAGHCRDFCNNSQNCKNMGVSQPIATCTGDSAGKESVEN